LEAPPSYRLEPKVAVRACKKFELNFPSPWKGGGERVGEKKKGGSYLPVSLKGFNETQDNQNEECSTMDKKNTSCNAKQGLDIV
jgi:hypothetical protein